jgi:hypothetical protein
MPGRFEPMLQVNRVDAQGLYFTAMGQRYLLSAEWIPGVKERLEPWRLMLPTAPQWTAKIAEECFKGIEALIERLTPSEPAYIV